MRYAVDVPSSKLCVWTFKEGLLSRVAHDLCFHASGWEASLERDGEAITVSVSVPVSGLKTAGQVKRGTVTPLKDKDHREIEENMRGTKVLDAARFPTISFTGSGAQSGGLAQLKGELTLKDRKRPLTLTARVREDGDGLLAEGETNFKQSEFGIRPFSALMGALKVQDGVRVSWSLRCRAL